jgi:ketosteroid isomerase-like protein
MSVDDIETARRGLAAFNRRDKAAWMGMCDPDLENSPPRDWPEAAATHGPEAVWDFLVENQEGWEASDQEWVELIEVGDGKVAAHQRAQLRGKASGVDVVFSYWLVITVREGKLARLEWFADRAAAFEAAELSQENVEVVRRFIEALPRAQASDDWRPVLAEVDPGVEIDDLDLSLDTSRYRGPESVREWIGDWMESWESWRLEDVQVLPVGADRAIGLFLVHAKGRGSGIELSRRDALVCSLRAGKIEKGTYYNEQQALEAVGLQE